MTAAAATAEVPVEHAPPVFIAGCGRSGTTYLRAVVTAHPDVFIPTESLFIAAYVNRGWALPAGLRDWLFNREPQLRSWYDGPPLETGDVPAAVRAAHEYAARRDGRTIWGQKTPRFIRDIDAFRAAWPGARFILVYRDPRGVAASMIRSPRHPFDVGWAGRRWVRDNAPVLRHLRDPRPDVMLVKYESLILHFDEHLPRLFEFVGVPPLGRDEVIRNGRVAQFTGCGFDVAANNVRDGLTPQPRTIDAWKQTLSERQCREVERICMPLMRDLGYDPLPDGPTGLKVRRLEPLCMRLDRALNVTIVWQYLRHWPAYLFHATLRTLAIRVFGLFRRAGGPSQQGSEGAGMVGQTAAATPAKRARGQAVRILVALATLALMVYVGRRYTDELRRLAAVSPLAVAGIVALYLPARWLSAEVLRISLASLGHAAVGAVEVVLLTFANSYANLVVPRAGLGLPAAYFKIRRGVPVADVSAAQLVGMTVLQTACIGVIGFGCLLLVGHAGDRSIPAALYGVFAAAAVGSAALLAVPIRVGPRWTGKAAGFARRLADAWRRLGRDRAAVAKILVIQSAVLCLRAARVQLCFHAIGQPIGFLPALTASLLADVGSLIGITPSGLGFREAAIVLAAGLLGTTRDVGLAAAVLDRAVTTAVVIVVGQIGMWRIVRPSRAAAAANVIGQAAPTGGNPGKVQRPLAPPVSQ